MVILAAGDMVSDIYTSASTFQPAAGVEICITQFLTTDENRVLGRGDTDTSSTFLYFSSSTGHSYDMRFWNSFIHKYFISNSSYIYLDMAGGYVGFIGVQTK